ncbi:hypothetical protein [Chitinilyticum litopenaei]|uniref:hypothetical protein n=1 Tax=Chitinilyticum litopenaei TaxID=1121276 RepID=UPI0009DC1841|nr:hypothetical protein [Chitinilyticum litopenaei]
MKELSEKDAPLEAIIISLTEEGNSIEIAGNFLSAIEKYQEAWDLLPEPKHEWEMLSGWLSSCFFSSHLSLGNFELAKQWAENAVKSASSSIDTAPFIDLGIACYELGQLDEAFTSFDRAYGYGKARAFKERPKKYLDFYLKKAHEK